MPASAGNGHFLHGIGAVNSSMGGAGVALPNDALGALNLNPALLVALDGRRFEFSVELNDAQNALESRVGPFSGRTEEAGDPAVIPSFGWTRHQAGARSAVGVGFLGLAGFGVDYPQDPRNPALAPQPIGLGRFYSNYQFLKIPFAYARQVNDRLSVGASLNGGWARLTGEPVGFAAPDCGPNGCFFPRVDGDSATGFGATLGLLWEASDRLNVGLAVSTPVYFDDFEWNTTHANPALPNFGTDRNVVFNLDAPPSVVAGLGWTPSDRLQVALDVKWIGYSSTDGFDESGIGPNGAVRGLGWDDIFVVALGAQFAATDRLTLRGGVNHGDNPIPDELSFFSITAPAVFEDHVTLGLGFRAYDDLTLNLGYYHVFENDVSGPIPSPVGPVPGTAVVNEMTMDAVLLTFSFDL